MDWKEKVVSSFFISLIFFLFINLNQPLLSQETRANPELKALLPELADWQWSEKPQTYFPGTLFEYIDGASEAYLSYDFKELLVAQYQKSGTETMMTVEIYDMGSALNAFGIFSSERYPENPEINLGYAGYLEEEVLNFASGRFYVKLICYNGEDKTSDYLIRFAQELDSKIKDKGSQPEIFSLFPAENRVKNSEKYIKKNFMGFDFLENGYAVTYRQGQLEFDGLIIDCGSVSEAQTRLQKIIDFYSGEKFPFLKEGNNYHQKNAYGQHVFLGQAKKYIFGLSRVPEDLRPLALKTFDRLAQVLESKK
ncbi:MAG: DUF6599 family protein [Candidatus Saccharicenans sp.]